MVRGVLMLVILVILYRTAVAVQYSRVRSLFGRLVEKLRVLVTYKMR
jgi:hypothetical protein